MGSVRVGMYTVGQKERRIDREKKKKDYKNFRDKEKYFWPYVFIL
jgi:hypothetical protein